MTMLIKPRSVSGFPDYNEPENVALSNWFSSVEEIFRQYGFSRLFPRPLELREVILSKGGAQKQVFGISRLPDDSPTELALPFDRTIPLANWIAKNGGSTVFPYKRFDISYSFRGERAQAGRFQAFFQADVDIVGNGALELSADAETIAVIHHALTVLNVGEAFVRVNHIALARELLRHFGVPADKAAAAFEVVDERLKVDDAEFQRRLRDVVGLDPATAEALMAAFSFEGPLDAFLARWPLGPEAETPVRELRTVLAAVRAMGAPEDAVRFSPFIVRGLDYYTGVVFEAFIKGLESYSSVGGGGRYDSLASTFTNSQYPGTGGSIGLSRLFEIARKNNLVSDKLRTEAEVCVGFRSDELVPKALEAAAALRRAGLRVDLYSGKPKVKNQLAYADRKGFKVALLVMDESSFVVRDMASSEQSDISSLAEAVAQAKTWGKPFGKGSPPDPLPKLPG